MKSKAQIFAYVTNRAAAAVSVVGTTLSLLRAMLREIFDESAYARFLTRNRLASSPDAYGVFVREQAAAKSRRPRCC